LAGVAEQRSWWRNALHFNTPCGGAREEGAMAQTARHDAWQAGDSYDQYMGRWSRQVAPQFLDWLNLPGGLDWLDIGCGTGALSAAIVARCNPKSLFSIDPSEGFLAQAQANVPDRRVTFQVADAQALPLGAASKDVVVSALVLNFVGDKQQALTEMKRVGRVGGSIGFYVWDYPGGGVEFMHAFWRAATALDPAAADLTEDKRFPFCTREGLIDLVRSAGLTSVDLTSIEVATVFGDFEDYWRPFTLGAGPAPGYCVSLAPEARQRLKQSLQEDLPARADGSIHLKARALAVRARSD
jgi:ubiquinone/menaquinone biosynthesis C-methylase UbiE